MREWCEGFGSEMKIVNPSTSNVYKGTKRAAMNFLQFDTVLTTHSVYKIKKKAKICFTLCSIVRLYLKVILYDKAVKL